ncbi:MAG: hypothetical protein ACJ764_01960 [Solirubrobacteraceae bacterium]
MWLSLAQAAPIATSASGAAPAAASGCDPIDPALCLLPWPNNFFTRRDRSTATGLRLHINSLQTPRNSSGAPIDTSDWNRLDGFSPGSIIVTHVPGMDNPKAFARIQAPRNTSIWRSLRPKSPIVVLDAQTGRRWPVWAEIDRSVDLNGHPPPASETALMIHPARNFTEGHRYIVALRDLKNADGRSLRAQSAFHAFIAGRGRPASRQVHYDKRIFAPLHRAGISRGSLYLAWDFTVASEKSLTQTILHMRDDALAKLGDKSPGDGIAQGRAPKFVVDSVTQRVPCSASVGVPPVDCTTSNKLDPRVFAHVQGYFLAPCYLDAPGCPSGSRFRYANAKSTIPSATPGNQIKANFQCNIPIGAKRGKTFRPLLNGHGLFGSADQVNSDELYALGQYGLLACATDEIGMAQEDIPNAAASVSDLSDFPSIPDRLQQGMIDFLYLGRDLINRGGFCASSAFLVHGKCVINRSHLYYDGGSQGAIFGGALTAMDPDFTRAALNVAGMNYSLLLTRSSDFPEFAQVLYRAYSNPLERALLYPFIQNLWDQGEMDGYAEHVTRDPLPDTPRHSVLMTIAFGDHQVTNWASEVEARTIGAHLRSPVVDPGRYPGPTPYWAIPRIRSFPYTGRAAMIVGDLGPLRPCPNDSTTTCEGSQAGTPPPPRTNNANTKGVDPHGPDWASFSEGESADGHWLRPGGSLPAVCGSHPCYMAGWNGL